SGVAGGSGNKDYILDGKTNLFDEIESALDDFREMLNGDYDLTDAERAAINAYIDALLSALS
ncbi:MAG: hypothetical protein LUD72_03670, partial [Bacteroidales bacterium]|nr:hypothetical protein [Bacteroidales bacterium]